ncbi:M10 family metallopeptidase C-terminal domain-containing protein [Shinella sp. M27]|uniref:M10 family metallopeptidase C-terminal domain-containing protein n=1 Tax=Shinella sp. M27 TaxID=3368614 RepID=UPI003BA0983D
MAVFTIPSGEYRAEIPGGIYGEIKIVTNGIGSHDLLLLGDVRVSTLILDASVAVTSLTFAGFTLGGTAGSDVFDFTSVRDFDWMSDAIKLGAGNDIFRAGVSGLWVEAGSGNDRLYGGIGTDTFDGGDGDDIIFTGGGYNSGGADELHGGSGADLFVAFKRSTAEYQDSNAEIKDFKPGVDRIDISAFGISSFTQLEHIFDDRRNGVGFNATRASSGNAFFLEGVKKEGISARDFIFYTGNARDVIGTNLDDRLFAAAGGSKLKGGHGRDELFGGAGADIFVLAIRSKAPDMDSLSTIVDFKQGTDRIDVSAYGISNFSQLQKTIEIKGDGNAWFSAQYGESQNQFTIRDVALSELTKRDFIFNVASVKEITGTVSSDWLFATQGGTTLRGGRGDDTLLGGDGDDTLDGGSGEDRMEGGKGNDIYIVNNRYDKIIENKLEGIDVANTSISLTLVANIENLILRLGDINGTGNELANTITGSDGNNVLKGMSGNDKLFGRVGNDTLIGGQGADDLYGGTGKDAFVFTSLKDSTVAVSGRDTIFDFSRTQGDRIDLSGIDAMSTTSKNDAFAFIGSKGFSGKAGELRFDKEAAGTYIYGDVDGNGKADFAIELTAAVMLLKGDFIL